MKSRLVSFLSLVLFVCAVPAAAQTAEPRVGLAVSASSLGVSFEAAARVKRKVNVRAGVNLLNYFRDFDDDHSGLASSFKARRRPR